MLAAQQIPEEVGHRRREPVADSLHTQVHRAYVPKMRSMEDGPSRGGSVPFSSTSQYPKPATLTSSGRTRTSDSQDICRNLNRRRLSSSSSCHFFHTCSQCGKDHPYLRCKQEQRRANRPPPNRLTLYIASFLYTLQTAKVITHE